MDGETREWDLFAFVMSRCSWREAPPQFPGFKLFGKTSLVVNSEFGLVSAHPFRR